MTRRIVVSGGGSGIGRAVARRLAVDGDRVVIVGRRTPVLEATAAEINDAVGDELVTTATADLTEPAQVHRLAGELAADGAVDVLVNNAGGSPNRSAHGLAEVADAYQEAFRVNVLTAVLLTEALVPHLTPRAGRIVAVSSIAGLRGAGPYGAAKAALHGWAMGLAQQLAPQQITVNVVAPGFVPDTGFWAGRLTDEVESARVAQIPLGRAGTPDEVAAGIAYLVSPEAGWTTGQILQINGGSVLGRG
ncbi:SDR family oxidoreductase [Rhodococcus sp. D2-41]|uniref:SDR family oxidoreductase n=1 Tax=Speluncibacter jeojiensis TaxID=2710754 RepID=A0A9X4LW78_9ACTN|nr:SDR family oxidoreductase [Rhodococcus sp. D2-41]MDG3012058.1 SDR family oxidoreductase [Rhodococcus sp. D2-41]MDG3013513.1 SDR family oxidoreductase [Corynebacteriales bacterium D3-21]